MGTHTELPNFLEAVDVTLYGTAAKGNAVVSFPMTVDSVELQHRFREIPVHGNPKDWIQRTYIGGQVTFKGCVFKILPTATGSATHLLQGKYLYSIKLGDTCTLYGCRKMGSALSMAPVSGDRMGIFGTLTYQFDSIS